MSADTRPGNAPEAPIGNELLRKTIELADKVLTDAYPILATSPYNKRLITPGKISFVPLEQMQAMEHRDKPTDASILYQALSLCGVPRENLNSRWFSVSEQREYYQESPDANLYVGTGNFDFSSPNPAMRSASAIVLGDFIIEKSLENAPTQRMLPPNSWRELMRSHINDDFIPYVAKQFGDAVDNQRLQSAQQMISSLFDTDIRIVARGVNVYVLFEGQTMTTFEYMIGRQLEAGIVETLSQEPKIKLRILMRQAGIIGKKGYPIRKYEHTEYAERVCRSITSTNLKSRSSLLSAYLSSEIPNLYRTSAKKGVVNPEGYAH